MGVHDNTALVALRNIGAGEELTFDYAAACDELVWEMPCHCGQLCCRGIIRSIQFMPTETFEAHLPFISPHRGICDDRRSNMR